MGAFKSFRSKIGTPPKQFLCDECGETVDIDYANADEYADGLLIGQLCPKCGAGVVIAFGSKAFCDSVQRFAEHFFK